MCMPWVGNSASDTYGVTDENETKAEMQEEKRAVSERRVEDLAGVHSEFRVAIEMLETVQ